MYSNESISYEEMKKREEEYRKKSIPGYNPAPHKPAHHNPLLLTIGWDLHQIPESHPTKNEKRVFYKLSNNILGKILYWQST